MNLHRWQVGWRLALPWRHEPPYNATALGAAAFAADGYLLQGRGLAAAHPIMDLASIAYTWLTIVHGEADGRAMWAPPGTQLDRVEHARWRWLSDFAGEAGVREVTAYLRAVYHCRTCAALEDMEHLYSWRVVRYPLRLGVWVRVWVWVG